MISVQQGADYNYTKKKKKIHQKERYGTSAHPLRRASSI